MLPPMFILRNPCLSFKKCDGESYVVQTKKYLSVNSKYISLIQPLIAWIRTFEIFNKYIFFSLTISTYQKQSSRGVLSKKCSYKFHKIHRKTPMPESLFSEFQLIETPHQHFVFNFLLLFCTFHFLSVFYFQYYLFFFPFSL